MTNALLVTSFPSHHVDGTVLPKLRAIGVSVVRVVSPRFDEPLVDFDAVLMMVQMTSEMERTAFRKRAHKACVPFLTLPQEASKWPAILANLPRTQQAAPPSAPPTSAWWPQKEAHEDEPEPPAAAPAAPASVSFGAWLKNKRAGEHLTLAQIGELCGVSGSLVGHWEADRNPIAPDHLRKLHELFGDPPAGVSAPKTTVRKRCRDLSAPLPSAENLPPITSFPAKTNGKPALPPLDGMRRAARALRMTGKILISIDIATAATTVQIGADAPVSGPVPDDAVENAAANLRTMLAEILREAQESQAALGGAHV